MLGLAAGFVPRFLPDDRSGEARCVYSPSTARKDGTVVHIPASIQAQAFLSERRRFEIADARRREIHGREILSLFRVPSENGSGLEDDIVAEAFFFLSLHDEWSSIERDAFDRFPAAASLLGRLNLLHRPVVAEYAALLGALLKNAGCELRETGRYDGRDWAVCLTHDIDYLSKFTPGFAWREVYRKLLRNEDGLPLGRRLARFARYAGAFAARRDPPAVTLLRILDAEKRFGSKATFFFKAGAEDKRDESYSLRSRVVRRALAEISSEGHEAALHPSFRTHTDGRMLARELAFFRSAASLKPASVRQHYLRFRYPETWRIQENTGFTIDSTLGFAEREGFRNGCVHPFLPYDREAGRVLGVWEMPLHVMDGTLRDYRRLNAEEAAASIRGLAGQAAEYRGTCSMLFHNLIYDRDEYPGWPEVFEYWADPSRHGAFCGACRDTLSVWLNSLGINDTAEVRKLILDGKMP